jgi:hypothetical protein
MALIHKATLAPTKLELLSAWLPSRPWFNLPAQSDLRLVGSYRFDDPAGEVGLEALLLQTGDGIVLQTPMTYRAAPRAGAEEHLIGTMEHSVLGPRWVYDACGDPVWATALATAVLTGAAQAEEFVDQGDRLEPREPSAKVSGSGTPGREVAAIESVTCYDEGLTTIVQAANLELVVVRVIGAEVATTQTLTGRWSEGGPAVLAGVRS